MDYAAFMRRIRLLTIGVIGGVPPNYVHLHYRCVRPTRLMAAF